MGGGNGDAAPLAEVAAAPFAAPVRDMCDARRSYCDSWRLLDDCGDDARPKLASVEAGETRKVRGCRQRPQLKLGDADDDDVIAMVRACVSVTAKARSHWD